MATVARTTDHPPAEQPAADQPLAPNQPASDHPARKHPAADQRLGFASQTEEVRVDAVPVHGEVPAWLRGGLVRVTPAQMDFSERTVQHWFDGMAMLHRFGFDGETVSYASRFLDTKARREALASGGRSINGFATDPCRSLFQRVQSAFSPELTDNANVNLTRLGDEYLALTETPIPIVFDRDTLATLGCDEVPAKWGVLTTAHPHQDPVTGELLNYAAHLGRRNHYALYARRSRAEGRTIAKLPVKEPSYMHSFAVTERHIVLFENPLRVNPLRLALSGKSFIHNFRWRPEEGVRIHVFDRATGALTGSHEAPAAFVFHHINAFDDGGELVLDLCAYEDASVIDTLELQPLREGTARVPAARPRRYRVPLAGGTVRVEDLADTDLELPRINYRRHNGRPYRYAYGSTSGGEGFLRSLAKIDVTDGTVRTWSADGCWAGEPVFVPRAGRDPDQAEDDGVILSVVLDAPAERSALVVLDAASFEEIARAEAPHVVPFGFHGQFFG
jgi:beta,beta-carotene 9',10'-dioxygenase